MGEEGDGEIIYLSLHCHYLSLHCRLPIATLSLHSLRYTVTTRIIIIIIMEICKAPTLRLKALNKHIHIMYIEMENVIFFIYFLNGVGGRV